MRNTFIPYIYSFFLLINSYGLTSQEYKLKITSTEEIEKSVLKKIDFHKKHKDSTKILDEIQKISDYLKNIGYFTNTIDSVTKKRKTITAFFSLGFKINKATLKINKKLEIYFDEYKINRHSVTIPIKSLQTKLLSISKKLDSEGKSFSKIQLENISIKNNILFADLYINESKKRKINKVVIKGYEEFPRSFLKNYFDLNDKTIFKQPKIKSVSSLSKGLEFAKEIKPPEVLFTKDSTFLYLYLKKQQNNSFDGIVNFTSKENGGILFNGNIDLKLNNVLNTGEKISLFWNSIGEERQEFELSSEIPYIFNTKFSPEISFSIYKQDSTFLNTKFDSKLFYNINPKVKLALTYNSETSENLETTITNNVETFNNYFTGLQFQYRIPKNDVFFNDHFFLEINPTLGQRKTNSETTNQFKIDATISYIWDLNQRSNFYIKNKTGYLNSDSLINNELFRIGGAESIRGYNEQSIFTSSYSYFNLEYRYFTSSKTYLYSITDFGTAKLTFKQKNLLGLGFGYSFFSKNSRINIGYVLNEEFSFTDSKIIFSMRVFF